jgi:hypothetical protein
MPEVFSLSITVKGSVSSSLLRGIFRKIEPSSDRELEDLDAYA